MYDPDTMITGQKHIMVIDDHTETLMLLKEMLEAAGYAVGPANSGELALAALERKLPDLILLDIRLPGMDGFDICREINRNPQSAGIPVIIISGLEGTLDKVRAFEAGAVDYITKPFQQEEVLARIRTHLSLRALQMQLRQTGLELEEMNSSLEKKVAQRTEELQEMYTELEAANAALEAEISEHLMTEKAMERARQEAEAANNAKTLFLANMSHEIRTPLNGIVGMADLTLTTPLDEEQKYYLTLVKKSSQSLHQIINDILDYAKIEAGMLQIEPGPFEIRPLIDDVMALFDASFLQKQLKHFVKISPEIPTVLIGDALRLKQILSNLVGNAVKFTPQGSIGVEVYSNEWDRQMLHLEFLIQDTGIGIPEELKDRIFDRFIQQDSSYKKQYQGTGLGLSITRHLVELMGGRIWVVQNPAGGSTFHFTCSFDKQPAAYVTPAPTGVSPDPRFCGKRILLVEDDMVSREYITILLGKHHYLVTAVGNGNQALEALKNITPDLILMDIQMPELDGVKTTTLIRSSSMGFEKHPPIIAMTAYAMKEDRDRFIAAGFDDYIAKPVKMNEVIQLIETWLGLEG